jgi:ADP-ribose pyrophosphatase
MHYEFAGRQWRPTVEGRGNRLTLGGAHKVMTKSSDNDSAAEAMGSPEDCLRHYRILRTQRPGLFRDPVGCPIAILNDESDIVAAQAQEAARRKSNNQHFPDVRIGVLGSDPYLGVLTRDAVRFADQSLGIYNRHIGESGCVILPKIGSSIVLIRIFRHATREWAWELPGGRISPGEEPDIAALHELEEEIGALRPRLHGLGMVHPYPAFSSARIHLYVADIDGLGLPQVAEGISSIEQISSSRLFEMVRHDEITDASAIVCIMKAQLQGFI